MDLLGSYGSSDDDDSSSGRLPPAPIAKKSSFQAGTRPSLRTTSAQGEELHTCRDCKECKKRSGFYYKQWMLKEGEGRCQTCWDTFIRGPNRAAATTQKTKGDAGNKRVALEEITGDTLQSKRPKGIPEAKKVKPSKEEQEKQALKRKQALEAKARQQALLLRKAAEREQKKYFGVYGVGYHLNPCNLPEGSYSREIKVDESLVGTYDIIFYNSFTGCGEGAEDEDISRTIKGKLNLSLGSWRGKPTLFGSYKIDDSNPRGCYGDHICARFVQSINGHHPGGNGFFNTCNGFNIFNHEPKGTLLFVMEPGLFKNLDSWSWLLESLEEQEDDSDSDYGDGDNYNGGALKKITKRIPLVLQRDKLASFEYDPRTGAPRSVPKSLEEADSLMTKYKDGANSWMHRHPLCGYKVPVSVAYQIRQYVTPEPVLFLEPGDLVMDIEDSTQCEYHKRLVLRKADN